ncbi:MAG TPA: M42 family peptidase, partial [Gemmatimonadales bacterium]
PGVEKKEIGDFKLGSGPVISRGSVVSRLIFDQLVSAAESAKMAYSIEAAPRGTNTDADAIYTARSGIATGLVSVPCRYMHSPNEMVALQDLEQAALLIAAWVRSLTKETSFIP